MFLIVYGGLGWLGLTLARRLGFPDVWSAESHTHPTRLMPSLILGVLVGVLSIIADLGFGQFNGYGALPHPSFPASIVASISAGIGEEVIFRALLIPVLLWLMLKLPFFHQRQNWAFWSAASISALLFGLGHLPSLLALLALEQGTGIPPILFTQMIVMNGVFALVAAQQFRKHAYWRP